VRRIVVGSRGSRLALIQTESALSQMIEMRPDLQFTLTKITTEGDRARRLSSDRLPGVGVFVKELESALLDGRIDMAVHSLKDMPTEIASGLALAAVATRLDPRDVLVSSKGKLGQLAPGSRIGTGSLRRKAQLLHLRPDLRVEMLRGNVDTRLRKVASGDLEAVIVAAAAMVRLGCEESITEYLPFDLFLPAPGQGALGIEVRSGDAEVAELAAMVNDQPTWCSVIAERAFLHALGAGCRAPVAALGQVTGSIIRLEGMVADAEGHTLVRDLEEDSAASPEQVGLRLAKKLQQRGASRLIAEARGR
jgi:hydroxymethylbilane synthase